MQSSIELNVNQIASILADVRGEASDFQNSVRRSLSGSLVLPTRKQLAISQEWRDRIALSAFTLAIAIVAIASIYDAFLVYKFREAISEENPICRWLISFDPDSVSVFLFAKMTSTFLVVCITSLLYKHWRKAGVLAVTSLLLFQAGLMYYLHFVDTYV